MSDSSTKEVDLRPVDPNTGKPIGPLAQPGYYPGFSTMDQQKFWDAKTRQVVVERVNKVPQVRFFDPGQARLLQAICDRVLPQDDRAEASRIPIMPHIDKRLFDNTHNGYRYANMPPDREAFTLGIQAIDQIAQHEHGRGFVDIGPYEQDEILRSLHRGKPSAGHEIWKRMPVDRFWMLLVTDCAEAYYSHPTAWDEIGFGGPAYPRGYMRLERGEAAALGGARKRYEWSAPEGSVSGAHEPRAGQEEQFGSPGQGGTH